MLTFLSVLLHLYSFYYGKWTALHRLKWSTIHANIHLFKHSYPLVRRDIMLPIQSTMHPCSVIRIYTDIPPMVQLSGAICGSIAGPRTLGQVGWRSQGSYKQPLTPSCPFCFEYMLPWWEVSNWLWDNFATVGICFATVNSVAVVRRTC